MIKEIEEEKLKELLKLSFISGYGLCCFDILTNVIEPGDFDINRIGREFDKIHSDIINIIYNRENKE